VCVEEQVYVITLNRAAPVLHSAEAISLYIHYGPERILPGVGRDCPPLGLRTTCCYANLFLFALVRAALVYRLKKPVPLPAATCSTAAVAGNSHFPGNRFNSGGQGTYSPDTLSETSKVKGLPNLPLDSL